MNVFQEVTATPMERTIMSLYAQGETYDKIQEHVLAVFGKDLSDKKLGYKMGALKKKFNCATQFQLGYKYAQDSINLAVEEIKKDCEDQKILKYQEGKEAGIIVGSTMWQKDVNNKSLVTGITTATIFWLVLFIAYLNIYCY